MSVNTCTIRQLHLRHLLTIFLTIIFLYAIYIGNINPNTTYLIYNQYINHSTLTNPNRNPIPAPFILHDYLNLSNISISTTFDHIQTPYSSLIPYRNASMMNIAWDKFRNGTGKLIHIHARKAGGSTIKRWMRTKYLDIFNAYFASKGLVWNSSREHYEMWTFAHKHGPLIDRIFKDNPFAIYVVHFRDPIERIISQYQFEWRWGCGRCSTNSLSVAEITGQKRNKDNFMKSEKKAKTSKQIEAEQKKYKLSANELDELLDDLEIYQNVKIRLL